MSHEPGTATLRGVEFGCDTAYPWVSNYPPGLLGTADVREQDVPLPRRDGVVAGHDHLGARTVAFELQVRGTSTTDAETLASLLSQAFAPGPDDEELTVRISGTPDVYSLFGRPRGVAIVPDRAFVGNHLMHARAEFVATDPARYGAEQIQAVGLDEHVLPQTLPFILGLHDSEPINVDGTAPTDRWTVTFDPALGPLSNPSITHVEQGAIVFADLTLDSGDTLVVDGRERRALLNGSTVVVPTIAQWFRLTPGAQSLRFAAGIDSDLTATATATWRPVFA